MQTTGIGTRVLNFLVDTIIITIISGLSYHGWNIYVLFYHYTGFNFGWVFFGTLFIYYTIFESLFSRTPGKWVTYSKVVNRQGKRPSFFQVILRSLSRIIIIDLFFIPFLDKTLHDFISKTEVVES